MPRKKKPKTYKTPNLKPWLTHKLRRISLQWPPRNEALRRARIDRGIYRCAKCGEGYHHSQVQLDHINPIVNVKDGFTTFDDYIKAMFPDVDGFQVLCLTCHEVKTMIEDNMRTIYQQKLDTKRKKE